MATNLRLRADAEAALRAKAARTGRSQQDLIRDAVDASLGLGASTGGDTLDGSPDEMRRETLRGLGLRPARLPYSELEHLVTLPRGVRSSDLLDREDR